jgi:hypothetical protein
MMRNSPNYKKIYYDIILKIFPERETEFNFFLEKENLFVGFPFLVRVKIRQFFLLYQNYIFC